MNSTNFHLRSAALTALVSLFIASSLFAEEGGTGHRLPGSGVSLTGILPTEPGLTVVGSNWLYWGDASGSSNLGSLIPDETITNGVSEFVGAAFGGDELPPFAELLIESISQDIIGRLNKTTLSIDVDNVQNISTLTLLYATPWKLFAGRYLFGVALPFAYVDTTVKIKVKGPERKASRTLSDNNWGFSDMVILPAIFSWHSGYFHWNTGLAIYAPTGEYSPSDLAPLGKGYWSFEPYAGVTFLHEKYGQEVSVGASWCFNTTNHETDYRSGDQINLEWLVSQHLPGGFSVGVTGYYYQQITGDSGSGAENGAFRRQSVAIGPTVGFTWKDNLAINAQWFNEVATTNTFKGNVVSVNASWTF